MEFCKTQENSNFLKIGKIVISVKIRNLQNWDFLFWVIFMEYIIYPICLDYV